MILQISPPTRTLRGPGIVKTARGIVGFAAIFGAIVLLAPIRAAAQGVTPAACLPGSTGPTTGESTPYEGGMCDLGSLRADNLLRSVAYSVSADGAVIVGDAATDDGSSRAFRWIDDGTGMLDLGSLRADNLGSSIALAVSADGAVIVGSAETEDGNFRAFRWIDGTTGMLDLGSLRADNLGSSDVRAVSADGAVIVGNAETEDGNSRAYRWIDDGTGMLDLGSLRNDNLGSSDVRAVSADGAVIVGSAETEDGNFRAYRWIDNGTGMLDLGSLRADNTGYSEASAVSADGAVIVGQARTDDGNLRAYRWIDNGNGMLDLGSLRNDNLGGSSATFVRADGAVIVGRAATDDGSFRAYRWIDDGTGMLDLGSLRNDNLGNSFPRDVSADGAVIVGNAATDDGNLRAFRWIDDGTGMLDLGSLRADNLGGSTALAVSADGAVIVGSAETEDGNFRAFIWRTQMQDLANLMVSFPVLANDTEIAVAQQQGVVGQLANQTCLAATGSNCMRSSLIGNSNSTSNTGSENIGSRSTVTGLLSYGYGVLDGLTLGGTLSFGSTRLNNNGFDMGSDLGAALWGRYSEGQLARTGWQGEAALGYGSASGDIARGRGLANVLLSTGEADMDTRLARASLGYGFNQAQGWLFTPTLGITRTRTTRGAYTETGGDFNASYDSLTSKSTRVDLSLSAETAINDKSRLTLTGGLVHDLSAARVVLTGTSDMPGMATFAVGSTLARRDTRGFFAAEYAYNLSATQTLSGSARLGQAAFGTKPQVGLGIHFDMKF